MSRRRAVSIVKYLIISLLALLVVIPFWDMVVNSFKTVEESAIPTIRLPRQWQVLENYRTVIVRGRLVTGFKNSVIITGISTVLVLAVSTMAAYVFGRRKEKRIRTVFFIFLMGIITPPSMIVSTLMMRHMGMLGTYHGMILFYAAMFCSLPIFILTSFMATIPRDLEEAAIIDGASPLGIFSVVTLPLLRPAIATTFIWVVLKIWNDFLFPIYILAGQTRKYTMILSLYYFRGQFYTAWNQVFALLVLVSIPVVIAFIFAQRQIVQGLTAGALKG